MKVYLGGPMSGLPLNKASAWRDYMARTLKDQDIEVFDPTAVLRNKLKGDAKIEVAYDVVGVRTQDTFNIDLYQLRQSDVMIANLKDWNEQSFGTAFEMGVAHSFGIPIICIGGAKSGNPFVCESSMLVEDIEDALELILNFE